MAHKLREWLAELPCPSGHERNLSAYMDGELDTRARASLERHLAACGRCRAKYEQLRFASRAVSHLSVPQVRPPAWQAAATSSRLSGQSKARARLESFWTMKLNVPAPLAAAAALALLFCLAGLLALGQLNSSPAVVEPLQTNALAPQIKFVAVPVERERIVTRTVYSTREGRSTGRAQPGSAINREQRAALIAAGAEREQRPRSSSNGELLTSTSLAGFRPATDANLRIVKEPEK
jgi:anti-sigma factor RsiW